MKCPKCGTENKDDAKVCRKCGAELIVKPVWKPDWKWHLKALAIIYVSLILIFFLVNMWLGPYLRKMPKDVTPWLATEREQAQRAK
jgi:DNA-directed RNA polymerase subunit RPC12/RpoP